MSISRSTGENRKRAPPGARKCVCCIAVAANSPGWVVLGRFQVASFAQRTPRDRPINGDGTSCPPPPPSPTPRPHVMPCAASRRVPRHAVCRVTPCAASDPPPRLPRSEIVEEGLPRAVHLPHRWVEGGGGLEVAHGQPRRQLRLHCAGGPLVARAWRWRAVGCACMAMEGRWLRMHGAGGPLVAHALRRKAAGCACTALEGRWLRMHGAGGPSVTHAWRWRAAGCACTALEGRRLRMHGAGGPLVAHAWRWKAAGCACIAQEGCWLRRVGRRNRQRGGIGARARDHAWAPSVQERDDAGGGAACASLRTAGGPARTART
jgi:hypothetical protein